MEGHSKEARRASEEGPPLDDADARSGQADEGAEAADARGSYAQELLLGQLGRAAVPLALLLGSGIVLGARHGFALVPLVLIFGSVLSASAMFLYALPSVLVAYGREPRPWMAVAALSGLIPYIFGLVVIFAIGLVRPFLDFSLFGAASTVFFLAVGFWFLRDYSRLTALGKRIDDVMEA